MAKPSNLARAIASKARQQKLIDAEKASELKRRKKEREALARANAITPDGFHPAMRAKLQDASKRAAEDPRARELVERAELQVRVERLRREKGIGTVSPPIFDGVPADSKGRPIDPAHARALALDASKVPPSVGEAVAEERKGKKR